MYKTDQEAFWAGDFGEDYLDRNTGEELIAQKIAMLSRILRGAGDVGSVAEFGCNIGLNLLALSRLNSKLDINAFEINETAAEHARKVADVKVASIVETLPTDKTFDLTFTIGVLIHIAPEALNAVYDNMVALSNKYVMVSEYYSRNPESLTYRGHEGKLFKRDFAGELMDRHNLSLVDYGFFYHRDQHTPLGDLNWFLMRKP